MKPVPSATQAALAAGRMKYSNYSRLPRMVTGLKHWLATSEGRARKESSLSLVSFVKKKNTGKKNTNKLLLSRTQRMHIRHAREKRSWNTVHIWRAQGEGGGQKGEWKETRKEGGKKAEEEGGRKLREERRKREDDVTPNFTHLEALQLRIWDAVAWCFASCK